MIDLSGLQLERPLAFIDTETTGLNPSAARIVELALVRVQPDGRVDEKVRRFNPGESIPAEATAVHGIKDADVAHEAPFARRARSLAQLLDPCDLAGFNIRRYDLPLLLAEFRRAGVEFDARSRRLIDVQQLFHRQEPRNLSAAVRFYLGRDADDAHSALADTRMTAEVFVAQLVRYGDLPRSLDGLHALCDEVGPFRTELDRWFDRGDDGRLTFRRGKHRGRTLADVATSEGDYLLWMIGADEMDPEVIDVVTRALHGDPMDPTQGVIPGVEPTLQDRPDEPFA